MIDEQPDWVKATLDLPMLSAPGPEGRYCCSAAAVAGRLTENATGQALPDYAQIHLRPRDMLKLGILYAKDGMWQCKRVLHPHRFDQRSPLSV